MKKTYLGLVLLIALLLAFGCSNDDPVAPDPALEADDSLILDDADKHGPPGPRPGQFYSMFFSNDTGAYSEFSRVRKHSGRADFLWSLQVIPAGDGETSFGWTPFGFAFDVDGTMYATQNIIAFDRTEVRSRFSRIDGVTGEITFIGEEVDFNTSGGDIDACGNFYVCGFEVPALTYIWGNDSLWHVDKQTGEFHEVGPTGHTHWMDLAFDRDGVLWGTFDNELYVIDTETGASTFVTEIHDVPDAGPPNFMEIMSIAFDKHDRLYGTGLTVYFDHPDGSPVLLIDTSTGETELKGYSHTTYANHGGDIMPSKVKVAHRRHNGEYQCKWVSIRSLPAHLAHGDYVPGTDGHDCDCP